MRWSSWRTIVRTYGGRCCACGALELDDLSASSRLTRDHVTPKALGGSLSLINTQPLCPACNLRKADRVIDYRPLALAHLGFRQPRQRVAEQRTIKAAILPAPSKRGAAKREWQRQNRERLVALLGPRDHDRQKDRDGHDPRR